MTIEEIIEEKLVEEKIINVSVYELNNDKFLTTYTATWCNPCKRLKENGLTDFLSLKVLISEDTIKKSEFKTFVNDYIPFFKIYNPTTGTVKSIQTSNFDEFLNFVNDNDKVLDLNTDF